MSTLASKKEHLLLRTPLSGCFIYLIILGVSKQSNTMKKTSARGILVQRHRRILKLVDIFVGTLQRKWLTAFRL